MADDTDLHLGQRLRQRRWMLGLTQSQVGERVGIKFQQVQKYETGQNRISASRLWKLSQALDIPISYFYEGLEEEVYLSEKTAEAELASKTTDLSEKNKATQTDRETIDLLRAYFTLPGTARRRILELVRALGRLEIKETPTSSSIEKELRQQAG